MDHETTANVIAHEKAHLHRWDHLRKHLGFMIAAIHWFNPLVWISYRFFCTDIELACDERVISRMSVEEKKSYAESLLTCSTGKRHTLVYPVAFGEVGVGTRVRQIFNYKEPSFYLIMLLAAVTGILATSSFTSAADKAEPEAMVVVKENAAPEDIKASVKVSAPEKTENAEIKKEKQKTGTDSAAEGKNIPTTITKAAAESAAAKEVEVSSQQKSAFSDQTSITVNSGSGSTSRDDSVDHVSVEVSNDSVSVKVKEGRDSVKVSNVDTRKVTEVLPANEVDDL